MDCYRITKYNPIYRDSNGVYTNEEWTAVSDVGTQYSGTVFTFGDYLRYENAYISAIRITMKLNAVTQLQLSGLEKKHTIDCPDILEQSCIEYIGKISNGDFVDYSNIDFCIRLMLREMMWGKLVSRNMFIHFGYDYYMYIGSCEKLNTGLDTISSLGLFLEKMVSPYL